MFVSLPACVSLVWGALCRFGLTLRQSTLAHWSQVALLMLGLSTLSWSQCFKPAPNMPNYPTGTNPQSIAVGDFNEDNWPDMAVVNLGSRDISVLLNNQQGGFNTPTTITGAGGFQIVTADFNGDSHLDLATTYNGSKTSGTVSLLLGDGQGSFGSPTAYAIAGTSFDLSVGSDMTVGDFNKDGKPDLATTSFNDFSPGNFGSTRNDVSVLLNNGQGGFGPATYFVAGPVTGRYPGIGSRVSSIASGDFNSDGNVDLIVSKYLLSSVQAHENMAVLWGDGKGGFGTYSQFMVTSGPVLVRVADFNKDNKPDLLIGFSERIRTYVQLSKGSVAISLGDGQGGFSAPTYYSGFGPSMFSMTIGDFNADGLSDVAIPNHDYGANNVVSILPGNGQGGFGQRIDYPAGSQPQSVAISDFNQDNQPDLAVANAGDNNVSLLYNCTSGGAQPALIGLSLINADNGQVIALLTDGQVLDLSTLPTRNLSIRADANPLTQSAIFALSGTQQHTKTETNLPFALFGDNGFEQYIPWTPTLGNYSLSVTPYPEGYGSGLAGQPTVVNFTVIETPAVLSLDLINADNGEVISPLTPGLINLSTLPTRNLSIRANTSPTTGSVKFELMRGMEYSKIESVRPFALFGDNSPTSYIPWTPALGSYRLKVTPYAQGSAEGTAGQPVEYGITFINEPLLTGLSLINADNGEVISPLANDQVLNLSALPTRNLSIRADASLGTGSVTFNLTGPLGANVKYHNKIESFLPFALFGDNSPTSYVPWTPPVGTYDLYVTSHTEAGATGQSGQFINISFNVVDQAPARRAALGTEQAESTLAVSVLGNPTPAESVEVDIRGAAGGSLDVVLLDEQGRIVSQQHVEQAETVEHRQVRLGQTAGIYLLRVATPTKAQTVRVLRLK